MKTYKKTKVTVQFELDIPTEYSRVENVVQVISNINTFRDNPFKVEVDDNNIKVVEPKHSLLTHKYTANSVAELFNNLAETSSYSIVRMLADHTTIDSIHATDEEVEEEVDDE